MTQDLRDTIIGAITIAFIAGFLVGLYFHRFLDWLDLHGEDPTEQDRS